MLNITTRNKNIEGKRSRIATVTRPGDRTAYIIIGLDTRPPEIIDWEGSWSHEETMEARNIIGKDIKGVH